VAAVDWLRLTVFALSGLAFGSFLTVVVHRVPREESVVAPRSACPACRTVIPARDNIPVLSYVVLGGRCRTCAAPISVEYPATEAATAALFVGASLAFRQTTVAGLVALLLGVALAAGAIDVRHRIIPNRLTYSAILVAMASIAALSLAGQPVSPVGALVGGAAFGGALFMVALISPGGMGMGDVKLAALIGLVLGAVGLRYVAVAAGGAVLLGGAAAIVALCLGRSRKATIPFGPFLAGGAAVAALAGGPVAAWYTSLAR
jgi:leader peptidase (prepilin peptidase)/N-methyltransferase